MRNILIELKWALIFVTSLLIWMFFEKMMGWHDRLIADHYMYTNIFALIAIAIYVLALLEKRKRFYKGHISYKAAFKSGAIMTLIILLFTPLVQLIIHTVVTPEYFENIKNYSVQSEQMSAEEAEEYFNLSNYIIQSLLYTPIQGLLTTTIVALFIRKRPKASAQ